MFTIGGGNYVEYGSFQEIAQRQQQPPSSAKHIIYRTTEILTGVEFIDQLVVLGQKMGLGSRSTTPSASAPAPAPA